MHLDIDNSSTTIWTAAELDELINDIGQAKKAPKNKRDEILKNLNRIFTEIKKQNAILIVDNNAE